MILFLASKIDENYALLSKILESISFYFNQSYFILSQFEIHTNWTLGCTSFSGDPNSGSLNLWLVILQNHSKI